ncbi:MAG: response regulator [Deltaproteobacteria bacterium]|nr:response regulator [Deltaproteobacteria bacterium]
MPEKKFDLNVLVVDDDPISLKFVSLCLTRESSYQITLKADGASALESIINVPPDVLITDWVMPGLDGIELCRRVRAMPVGEYIYIILLTAKTARAEIISGLTAGADDYVFKPFDREELSARVRSGARIIRYQKDLRKANDELSAALTQIKTLKGLLPICMDCKKIRDDQEYWLEIEDYVRTYTDAQFSHGLCPTCAAKRMAEIRALKKDRQTQPS